MGVASGKWFIAENRQLLSLQRTVIGMIVNVMLNLLFIPSHGVIGAAFATVVAQFCVGVLYDAFQKETRSMFKMKLKTVNPCRLMSKI